MYRMRQPKTGRLIGWIAIPFLCVILFVLDAKWSASSHFAVCRKLYGT